MMMTISY